MATHTTSAGRRVRSVPASRGAAQAFALLFGFAFLAVGIAGFVPSLTDNAEQIENYGTESTAMLLGLFQVSTLHNVVHIVFGVIGLLAARALRSASSFLIGGGLVYLGLTAYGWLIDLGSEANFLPLNRDDNWLHLGLGASMLMLGLLTVRPRRDVAYDDDYAA